jgi:signal transduction histidine kinase
MLGHKLLQSPWSFIMSAIKPHIHHLLVSATLLVVTLTVSIVVSSLSKNRTQTELYEARLNETFAIAVGTHVEEVFRHADQFLTLNRETFLKNPKGLRKQLEQHNRVIDRARFPLEAVINANGRMLISATSEGIITTPIDLSDRLHYRYHADHANPETDDIFISEVVTGRVSGKPVIQVSRSFRDPSHKLLAVGVMSIDPEVFISPYVQLVKNNRIISVIGTDKFGRIRVGEHSTQYSVDYSTSETFSRILGLGEGSLKAESSIDGKDRLYGFTKISKLPLIILVSSDIEGTPTSDDGIGALTIIALLLMIALTALMIMAIWTQRLTIKLHTTNGELAKNIKQMEVINNAQIHLMASISHEIRTPLHGISGHAQLLLLDMPTRGQHTENLNAILNAAKYLRSIVGQLLDIGRIEAGRGSLTFKRENLESLIEEVCKVHAGAARRSGLEFSFNVIDITGLFIETDALALKRCLHNLLSNAIKFTSKGKVELQAVRGPNETIHIQVQDTGPGIASENIAHVFDLYTHLSQTKRNKLLGTGLGLALCKRFTMLLGGELTLHSRLGSGSTFTMILPGRKIASSASPAGACPTDA